MIHQIKGITGKGLLRPSNLCSVPRPLFFLRTHTSSHEDSTINLQEKTFPIAYIRRRPSPARSAPNSLSDEATVVQGPSPRGSTGPGPLDPTLASAPDPFHWIVQDALAKLSSPTSWSRSPARRMVRVSLVQRTKSMFTPVALLTDQCSLL